MLSVTLDAVIICVKDDEPMILCVRGQDGNPALPSGPLLESDRTLELGLRRILREKTGLEVGYAEQLYTFGDSERYLQVGAQQPIDQPKSQRPLSIAYLTLVHLEKLDPTTGAQIEWVRCYDLLPWEDHRVPQLVGLSTIAPIATSWAGDDAARQERVDVVFGLGQTASQEALWDGVRVLERYELLYELGLLSEDVGAQRSDLTSQPMSFDHRRIVATALGRLRGKLTYRPVVFELLAPTFSLLTLQRLVEALSGVKLHKQNFRRLVENAGLVERSGVWLPTKGRPAEQFRFRRDVVRERPAPGVGMPWVRT